MNDLRARASDLCIAEAMPFQQHHEYRTTHPIKDVLHEFFFLPLKTQLYAGDSITICRFDKMDGHRRDAALLEFATVRVVSSGPTAQSVPLMLAGAICEVVATAKPPAKPAQQSQARAAA